MRPALAFAAFLALAACGADGPPERPAEPGVTITGQVEIGVAGS